MSTAVCLIEPSAITPGDEYISTLSGEALCGRQADARARELRLGVQALEGIEELPNIGHLEARAVVAHEVRRLAIAVVRTELDPGRIAGAGEFPGVA